MKPAFHWLNVSLPEGEKQPACWPLPGFVSFRLTLASAGYVPFVLRFSVVGQSANRMVSQVV